MDERREPNMTNHLAELQRRNVKNLMHELNLNMKEFSEKAGISYGTCTNNFGKSESRAPAPSAKTITAIETNMELGEGYLSCDNEGRPVPVIENGSGNMATVVITSEDGSVKIQMTVTKDTVRRMIEASMQ